MSRPGKPAAFVVIPEFMVKPDLLTPSWPWRSQMRRLQMGVECRPAVIHLVKEDVENRFREGFPALGLEERPIRFASRHHG